MSPALRMTDVKQKTNSTYIEETTDEQMYTSTQQQIYVWILMCNMQPVHTLARTHARMGVQTCTGMLSLIHI